MDESDGTGQEPDRDLETRGTLVSGSSSGASESAQDDSIAGPPNDATHVSKVEPVARQVAKRTSVADRAWPSEDANEVVSRFVSLILRNNPHCRLAKCSERLRNVTLERWGLKFDKINKLTGTSWKVIRSVAVFSQNDGFWSNRIIGVDNLWDNWEQITRDHRLNRRSPTQSSPTQDLLRERQHIRDLENKRKGRTR